MVGTDLHGDGAAKAMCPVVAIGASAGGLAALEGFFREVSDELSSGLAFVIVQHLAPDRESMLTELIGRCTRMPVQLIENGMRVRRGCTYVIPPGHDLALTGGAFVLLESTGPRGLRLPIDRFFRSLAQDMGDRAIGIVLSGTGTDGASGIRALKGAGGMAMAQDPESTRFDGMPLATISTGLVDYVLRPEDMPARIGAFVGHAFGTRGESAAPSAIESGDVHREVSVLLRDHTGHDFSLYKVNTITRRVQRRMAVHQITAPGDYVRFLQRDSDELEALFRDLLIGVTGFFRDPEAFASLEDHVVPRLLLDRSAGAEVRIWIAGCSTGEEAYSTAILMQEQLETLKRRLRLQIFATDIDRSAIDQARAGVFPASIAADVSPERLERFFSRESNGAAYRIIKSVRDLLVFSEQDVIRDPPFSRLDLISCRNLMIYMNRTLQSRLLPMFHYALKPDGFLFLGSSETVGEFTSLFSVVDRRWKLFRRRGDVGAGATQPRRTAGYPGSGTGRRNRPLPGERPVRKEQRENRRALTESTLVEHYAHVAVLIDPRGEILHIHGRTGSYLEPAPGSAGLNVMAMAREGLNRELTTAIHRVVTDGDPVRRDGVRVRTNGDFVTVNLVVKPVAAATGDNAGLDALLVIIEEVPEPEPGGPDEQGAAGEASDPADPSRISALERDLQAKEEYLQATLEQLETSNEELRSSNEEMQSVNEELQSSNEELETSKEELQSVNEELATVNSELQVKVADLSRSNNDLNNLLAGTGVGTLFVDHDLKITRFTPAAAEVINLIPTDVGRPVGHIVSNLVGHDGLVEDVRSVLETLAPLEQEVRTRSGEWRLMGVRPYRTLDNVIEGAVITFVDITRRKKAEMALQRAQQLGESIVATVRQPLVVLDADLRVVLANEAFYRTFSMQRQDAEGRRIFELSEGQWDIPDLRRLLEEIIPDRNTFDGFEVPFQFEEFGQRTLRLDARRVDDAGGGPDLILVAIDRTWIDEHGETRPCGQ